MKKDSMFFCYFMGRRHVRHRADKALYAVHDCLRFHMFPRFFDKFCESLLKVYDCFFFIFRASNTMTYRQCSQKASFEKEFIFFEAR